MKKYIVGIFGVKTLLWNLNMQDPVSFGGKILLFGRPQTRRRRICGFFAASLKKTRRKKK
jgi:hypothetical protein